MTDKQNVHDSLYRTLQYQQGLQRLHAAQDTAQILYAREQGMSWQRIADALGTTRQALTQQHQRNERRKCFTCGHEAAVHAPFRGSTGPDNESPAYCHMQDDSRKPGRCPCRGLAEALQLPAE